MYDPLVKWFKTLPFHGSNMGSNPVRVTLFGGLAQLGEHLPYKQRVTGSIPVSSISSKWFVGPVGLRRLPVTQEITSSSLVRTVVAVLQLQFNSFILINVIDGLAR